MGKKENKRSVNEYGAFLQIPIEVVERNSLDDAMVGSVPEDAFVFKGIASTGALNDNDYIIRESAWKNAIPDYMKNPIVLFQHCDDKGIGNTIKAEVTENGLEVVGYIFRDLDKLHTGGAIEKGVYRAISTGHIPYDFEFENIKTGQVISKDEYKAMADEMGWFGSWSQDWKRAVTALRYAEWSVVAVGSNKAALRTNKTEREILSLLFEMPEKSDSAVEEPEADGDEPEKAPDEKPVAVAEAEAETAKTSETPEPAVEAKADNAVVTPEAKETNSVSVEPVAVPVAADAVQAPAPQPEVNQIAEVEALRVQVSTLASVILSLNEKHEELRKVVNLIPAKKGLVVSTQWKNVNEPVKDAGASELKSIFARAGVKLKE